jgi:hypothetical protein
MTNELYELQIEIDFAQNQNSNFRKSYSWRRQMTRTNYTMEQLNAFLYDAINEEQI